MDYIYELFKELNDQGCSVSISEVKDLIDILDNVDLSDKKLVERVVDSTLIKNKGCNLESALASIVRVSKEIKKEQETKKSEGLINNVFPEKKGEKVESEINNEFLKKFESLF